MTHQTLEALVAALDCDRESIGESMDRADWLQLAAHAQQLASVALVLGEYARELAAAAEDMRGRAVP